MTTNCKAKRGRSEDRPLAITPYEYGGIQEAFDHFAAALFAGALPDVFIAYNVAQAGPRAKASR